MELKQLIILRKDLGMGAGKAVAQGAHASLEAYEKTLKQNPKWIEEWKEHGKAKIVLKVNSEKELLEWFERLKKLFPAALIKDAGKTQVEAGEPTCIGIGPAPADELDRHTKELKLL